MKEIVNHGYGIVTFKCAHNVDIEKMIPRLEQLEKQAIEKNFRIVYNENNEPIHAINEGGFIYGLEEMTRAPLRLQNLGKDWYEEFETALYACLLRYVEIFPAILPCLWWKSVGHILSYSSGASLGLHCDNDVNYKYGNIPAEQHATRNVLSAIIFLNSSIIDFDGGTMTFPYANVEITPSIGDIVFFPANYTAAHQINQVISGKRYSYLAWFAQGSEDTRHNISPTENMTDNGGQVWLKTIVEDYDKYITDKYGENPPAELVAHRGRKNDHAY